MPYPKPIYGSASSKRSPRTTEGLRDRPWLFWVARNECLEVASEVLQRQLQFSHVRIVKLNLGSADPEHGEAMVLQHFIHSFPGRGQGGNLPGSGDDFVLVKRDGKWHMLNATNIVIE